MWRLAPPERAIAPKASTCPFASAIGSTVANGVRRFDMETVMTAAALHEAVPAAPASATAPGRSLNRLAYVDALRVVLIMLVVAHHSVERSPSFVGFGRRRAAT